MPQPLSTESLRYVLAPMVDQSDLPFRLLCRKYGATMTYTQMFLASDLVYNSSYRSSVLRDLEIGFSAPLGRPVVVQLAGNDPDLLVQAGQFVQHFSDAIDLNLGCPQHKALEGNYGGYLIVSKKSWPLVEKIVSTMATRLIVPIHVKIRLCSPQELTPVVALKLANAGASVVAVHARHVSARRRRKGLARLESVSDTVNLLRDAKSAARVLSNGNVRTHSDVIKNMHQTGADGAMIGEAFLSCPSFLNPMDSNPLSLTKEYICLCLQYPECVTLPIAIRHVKSMLEFDTQLIHSSMGSRVLDELTACESLKDIRALLDAMNVPHSDDPNESG